MRLHITVRSLFASRSASLNAADRRHVRLALCAAIASGVVGAAGVPASAASPSHPAQARPAAAPVQLAASTPAGRLTPRGCLGAGTVSCDLYAMAGTNSVLGTPVPIWGFSSTGTAGSATAPGPVLVVNQGDHVTITLHNDLAENVSLALPGQAPAAFTGAIGDDLTGAAPGATRAYTFTADRPGTFLYEAGHTADGARQVAMGLAGALVVLPSDGTAYGTVAGMPATGYNDEAVLVLSEIDPALNADPANFDMRLFAPKYRLINGKAFPSTDEVATDQGHTVLLRYVNAGAQTHAMSLLGASQVEVAQDAHPAQYATTLTAESIEPGSTVDTLVTVPGGPEQKLALYEPAQRLDNNGQTTANPLQTAFGGMMTFVDTNAPLDPNDNVGPVSTHIKATPNPSDGKTDVTITADLSDATTGNHNVTAAEFVVDDAVTTGVGHGIPMMGAFGAVDVAGATATLPAAAASCTPANPGDPVPVALNCLDAGKHIIYVRAQDAGGNWGAISSVVFNLPKTGPQTVNGSVADNPANGSHDVALSATGDDSDAGGIIDAAEYFIDTFTADGDGYPMTVNRAAAIVSEDAAIPAATVAGLTEGMHHLLVHSHNSLGLWGPTLDVPLTVDLTGPAVTAAAVGPNPTNGLVSDPANPGYLQLSAEITDRDGNGALQSNLVDAEAFIDSAGAAGTGLQLVAVDGAMNDPTEAVHGLIPLSQIRALTEGAHQVFVRGMDAAGNWGPLFAAPLTVDRTAPVLGALSASPNPTGGANTLVLTAPVTDVSLILKAEAWFGTVDPGVGKATQLTVNMAGGQVTVNMPLGGAPVGTQKVSLRVQDGAGNWSAPASTTITVQPPNLIFVNGFESAEYGLWATRTGGVASTTAAALPNVKEPASTRGLQVTEAGGRNNRAGYVTDVTPVNEATYHARFQVNRNTLVGSTILTVFEARNAANAAVFSVQYRMNGTTAQLRTVLNRSTGAALAGAWVNLGNGSHTVQLDWAAGTNGSVSLRIDSGPFYVTFGNNNTLRVDTVLLGVTAGFTTTASGTTKGSAYFDSFASARNSLP